MKICLHTGREGLETIFGPLELCIMEILWEENKTGRCLTNKEILYQLDTRFGRSLSLSTVSTTTLRLGEKGLIERTLAHGKTHVFAPTVGKDKLIATIVRSTVELLQKSWPVEFLECVETHHATESTIR